MALPGGFGRSPDRGVLRPRDRANNVTTMPTERMYERRRPIRVPTDGVTDIDQQAEGLRDDPTEQQRKDDDAILQLARRRFQTASNYESKLREEMVEDQRFYSGNQWPDEIITNRTNDKRPILTVNRLPQFVKQITNPQRQARPAIQVNPIGDGADVDTAEVIQGIIRHIENTSHAEVAYDEAFQDAVICGRGWFRVLTEYVGDGSFEQEIVVRRVPNTLSVYPDPASMELDYSDARFIFITEDLPRDEYEDLYGEASAASLEMFQAAGNRQPEWFPEGRVRIAEYWYVTFENKTIALVEAEDGTRLIVPQDYVPEGATVLKTRETRERVVHWVKMNAVEILERRVWPGHYIPLVPVLGDEVTVDGERTLKGIVRDARDPQRMYNYWVSAETEAIALAPRAPYIGAAGQFKGYEAQWKQANTKNLPYLEYNIVGPDGKPIGPPQRQQYEPAIQAIALATKQADNDLKATMGLFDASLGERGPEQSGKAILARQKQGETANVNFIDNLARALWHAGRVYLDLIPKIYDTARVVHILGGDDQQKQVIINQEFIESGKTKLYDLTVGRYNVTLSVGPNYSTRRQEGVAAMLELIKADPQMIAVFGDILVGEMDWPAAKQIAKRLQKTLPPQLREDDGQGPDPQQVMSQNAQLKQLVDQQHALLGRQSQMLESKEMEIASKERIAMSHDQATIAVAEARFGSAEAIARLEKMFEHYTAQTDRLHEWMLQKDSQGHEAAMAAAGARADADAAATDAGNQAAATASDQAHERDMAAGAQAHEQGMAAAAQAAQSPSGGTEAAQ